MRTRGFFDYYLKNELAEMYKVVQELLHCIFQDGEKDLVNDLQLLISVVEGLQEIGLFCSEHLAQAAAERLPEVGQLAPKLHADFGAGFAENAPQLGFVVTLLLEESANRKKNDSF